MPYIAGITSGTGNNENVTVTLPSDTVAGDLLVILAVMRGDSGGGTVGAPTISGDITVDGWDSLGSVEYFRYENADVRQSGMCRYHAFSRVSDGSDSATMTVTVNTNASLILNHDSCYLAYRLQNAGDIADSAISETPNPGQASMGSDVNAACLAVCARRSSSTPTPPSGYENFQNVTNGALSIHAAQRYVFASSEDPSTFTGLDGEETATHTIAAWSSILRDGLFGADF